MAHEKDDWRIVYMPMDQITSAKGIVNVHRDKWWAVDPEKGLLFWQPLGKRKGKVLGASPQCNSNKSIADLVIKNNFPFAEIVQLPLVMAPIDPLDYA